MISHAALNVNKIPESVANHIWSVMVLLCSKYDPKTLKQEKKTEIYETESVRNCIDILTNKYEPIFHIKASTLRKMKNCHEKLLNFTFFAKNNFLIEKSDNFSLIKKNVSSILSLIEERIKKNNGLGVSLFSLEEIESILDGKMEPNHSNRREMYNPKYQVYPEKIQRALIKRFFFNFKKKIFFFTFFFFFDSINMIIDNVISSIEIYTESVLKIGTKLSSAKRDNIEKMKQLLFYIPYILVFFCISCEDFFYFDKSMLVRLSENIADLPENLKKKVEKNVPQKKKVKETKNEEDLSSNFTSPFESEEMSTEEKLFFNNNKTVLILVHLNYLFGRISSHFSKRSWVLASFTFLNFFGICDVPTNKNNKSIQITNRDFKIANKEYLDAYIKTFEN